MCSRCVAATGEGAGRWAGGTRHWTLSTRHRTLGRGHHGLGMRHVLRACRIGLRSSSQATTSCVELAGFQATTLQRFMRLHTQAGQHDA